MSANNIEIYSLMSQYSGEEGKRLSLESLNGIGYRLLVSQDNNVSEFYLHEDNFADLAETFDKVAKNRAAQLEQRRQHDLRWKEFIAKLQKRLLDDEKEELREYIECKKQSPYYSPKIEGKFYHPEIGREHIKNLSWKQQLLYQKLLMLCTSEITSEKDRENMIFPVLLMVLDMICFTTYIDEEWKKYGVEYDMFYNIANKWLALNMHRE